MGEASSTGGATTSAELSIQGKADSTTEFPFMWLARELRDEIYDMVLEEEDAILSFKAPGRLITTSRLAEVSRQVRSEFFLRLIQKKVIKTAITNMNFSNILYAASRGVVNKDKIVYIKLRFDTEPVPRYGQIFQAMHRFYNSVAGNQMQMSWSFTVWNRERPMTDFDEYGDLIISH